MPQSEIVHVTGRAQHVKVSKVGGGYVHRPGSKYRCGECLHFLEPDRCQLFGPDDEVKAKGSCVYWAQGKSPKPDGDDDDPKPVSAYTPQESGYTEDPKGTQCRNCRHFDGKDDCEVVDRESVGDDKGKIMAGACCANQEPAK